MVWHLALCMQNKFIICYQAETDQKSLQRELFKINYSTLQHLLTLTLHEEY
jgi:hypothetical protein